jgi:C4-dicarboxylate-specific signal transduction histidine kinase
MLAMSVKQRLSTALEWSRLGAIGAVITVAVIQGHSEWLMSRTGPEVALHTQEFAMTLTVVNLTLVLAFFAWLQTRITAIQVDQAEELANRKDEALISAIESLTQELKRRPAPNPAEIHLSLFGLRK